MHDSWWRCQAYLGGCYQYNYNMLLYLSTSIAVFPRKHSVILFCCSVIYVVNKCCLLCNIVSLFMDLPFLHNTTGIMISSLLLCCPSCWILQIWWSLKERNWQVFRIWMWKNDSFELITSMYCVADTSTGVSILCTNTPLLLWALRR